MSSLWFRIIFIQQQTKIISILLLFYTTKQILSLSPSLIHLPSRFLNWVLVSAQLYHLILVSATLVVILLSMPNALQSNPNSYPKQNQNMFPLISHPPFLIYFSLLPFCPFRLIFRSHQLCMYSLYFNTIFPIQLINFRILSH